jgi:hypothetical protein
MDDLTVTDDKTVPGLDSWKAEFYPVEAKDCPKEKAISHSLVKWRGLRPEALKRHNLKTERYFGVPCLVDGPAFFFVNADTCALCVSYYDEEEEDGAACEKCPLALARDGVPCTSTADNEDVSPYGAWDDNDPEPMIAALEKALAMFPEERSEPTTSPDEKAVS